MKCYFFIILSAFAFASSQSYAQVAPVPLPGEVITSDPFGSAIESSGVSVGESINVSGVKKIKQGHKMMAAIGTAKKSVSDFVTKQKEKIEAKMEKLEKYKKRVEEQKAKILAKKAKLEKLKKKAEEKVNKVKDKVNDVRDKVNDVRDTVNDAKDKVNDVIDKANNLKDNVKDTVNNVKNKANDLKDDVKSRVNNSEDNIGDNASSATNNNSSDNSVKSSRQSFIKDDNTATSPTENNDENNQDIYNQQNSEDTPDNSNGTEQPSADSSLKNYSPNRPDIAPKRKSFEVSSGYGRIHQSIPLSFASADMSIKSGSTPEDVLIITDAIDDGDIDYDKATQEKEFDKFLKEKIKAAYSKQQEQYSVEDIKNANTALSNAYLEYLAAAFFEALEIYNDSLTFKNKLVEPITTSELTDEDTAWLYAYQMQNVLGGRINALNRLLSRELMNETFRIYSTNNIKDLDE